MKPLRVAVIGVGHLGKEHARIMASLPDVELVGVVDVNAEQAETIARKHQTRAHIDFRALLPHIDAATVAVPTFAHREVGLECLARRIPVMIEKPLALNLQQAEELLAAAQRNQTLLQVGHIERFNPAVLDLEKRTFRPKFVEGERLSMFSGRSLDVGVVLDLMIHDLDVLLALVRSPVKSVEAVGVSLFGKHEDIANARLTFENGCVANLTASRASMKPSRKMKMFSPEGYVAIDFFQRHATIIQPSEQMRREGLDVSKLDPAAIKDKLFGQYLEIHEHGAKESDQLTAELSHFVECVRTGSRPKVSGEDGRDAIALAERILAKIHSHQWEGRADGPIGPVQLPDPAGPLFAPAEAA